MYLFSCWTTCFVQFFCIFLNQKNMMCFLRWDINVTECIVLSIKISYLWFEHTKKALPCLKLNSQISKIIFPKCWVIFGLVILHLIISWQWCKVVSTQMQLVIACTHSLFLCARENSLGARNFELRFANKRVTSLPGDDETEYRHVSTYLNAVLIIVIPNV